MKKAAEFLSLSLIFVLALSCANCAGHKAQPSKEAAATSHPWGHYIGGPPATTWNGDGRTMTLLRELRYTDPNGSVWVAPAGATVDGASIPRSLWSFMGGPFEGKYRNASILHDVSYDKKNRPPEDCDRMFYHAMRCSGVGPVEAKTMYYALLRFGRHWKFQVKRAKPLKLGHKMVARAEPEFPRAVAVNEEEIESARDWIRNAAPTEKEIERRAAAQFP
ncbi:MAG: DUF1353 domain-containing protein [Chthoniobacterales bacterium]|nr:DUF1353 domain-containing protein [Chthoniobacterales bacterium]